VYCFDDNAEITGNLHLATGNSADPVWVFQIKTTLLVTAGSAIIFDDIQGRACNVYFQVGSSATLMAYTDVQASVLAYQNVFLSIGASIKGHVVALNAAITMITNTAGVAKSCGSTIVTVGLLASTTTTAAHAHTISSINNNNNDRRVTTMSAATAAADFVSVFTNPSSALWTLPMFEAADASYVPTVYASRAYVCVNGQITQNEPLCDVRTPVDPTEASSSGVFLRAESSSSNSGLSAGEIAALVVCLVLGIPLLVLAGVFIHRRTKPQPLVPGANKPQSKGDYSAPGPAPAVPQSANV